MSQASYSIYIDDPFGNRLADASSFVALQYTRVVNDIGKLIIVLPGTFNDRLLRVPDGRIEVWRRLPGASREYLDTDTTWLMKAIEYVRDDKGRTTIKVEADTPTCLLKEPGRFVDVSVSADQNRFDEPYDDMIKGIFRQNAGVFASTARDLSAYLTCAANLSAAPVGDKAISWRELLKCFQEIASTSAQAGTYLAFDIVAPTPNTLELRTYTGQRGVDHRFPSGQNPILIGPDFGNVGECSLRTDYRGEVTYALAGGKGDGGARLVASAQNDTGLGASPFGRREKFVNATQYTTTTGLAAEAEAVIRTSRPRAIFRGKLISTPDTRYGVHWSWGDFVTVQAFNQSFDCRIDAVSVQVERGRETINAVLRNDQ